MNIDSEYKMVRYNGYNYKWETMLTIYDEENECWMATNIHLYNTMKHQSAYWNIKLHNYHVNSMGWMLDFRADGPGFKHQSDKTYTVFCWLECPYKMNSCEIILYIYVFKQRSQWESPFHTKKRKKDTRYKIMRRKWLREQEEQFYKTWNIIHIRRI